MEAVLKVFTGVIGLVAVLTGAAGIFFGQASPLFAPVQGEHVVVLDNMLRFYCGVWLGLAALWVSTRIASEPALFRAVWLMILVGGLGRLASLVAAGSPGPILLAVMGSELASVVVLALHARMLGDRASAAK